MIKLKEGLSAEDKKMLNKIFLRSFTIFASWNQVRASGVAYEYCMFPVFNRYYKTKEERTEAMKRSAGYFDINSALSTFPLGLAASMEKENSEAEDFDTYSINAVKASLMGPLSGIGDSFFWGTFRVIAAGIGISLGKQGSILGPIIFLVLYNIPFLLARYYGTYLGFTLGSKYIKDAYENGIMALVTKGVGILGLMMVGGMICQTVGLTTTLSFNMGGLEYKMQEILDQILEGMLPLLATFGCFALIRKKISPNVVLVGIIILSMILSFLGICG